MGDTPLPSEPATAVIVGDAVDDVDEREKSGEEEEGAEGSKVEGAEGSKVETEKKAEADKNTSEGSSTDKKPVKEKTKTAEKRGLKRSGEEPGGATPKSAKNAQSSRKWWSNWNVDCKSRKQNLEWRKMKS